MDDEIKIEEEIIPPLKGVGTNEVSLEKIRMVRAKTDHFVAVVRYCGGIIVILSITFACLYNFIYNAESPAYADTVKLLFLISGAIVGSLYASTGDRNEK